MARSWQWQKVMVKNRRGLQLAGLLHVSPPAADRIVIMAHGFTGSKEGGGRAVALAEDLGSAGFGSLLFDFAGCGESEGEFRDVSLSNHIADLRAVYDYCRAVGFSSIVLIGRSFGGNAAICFAAMEEEVAAVCAWATPANPWQLFKRLLLQARRLPGGILELSGDKGQVLHLKEDFLADLARFDIKRAVSKIGQRPLLILQGGQDELVPVTDAYSLMEAAVEPKRLTIVPGGDHQFSVHSREACLAVMDWLGEQFSQDYSPGWKDLP